jgi:hypothetical protein
VCVCVCVSLCVCVCVCLLVSVLYNTTNDASPTSKTNAFAY